MEGWGKERMGCPAAALDKFPVSLHVLSDTFIKKKEIKTLFAAIHWPRLTMHIGAAAAQLHHCLSRCLNLIIIRSHYLEANAD